MTEILVIRARLRKRRDRDIQRAVSLLELEEGELSDLVREGFRKVLEERGVLEQKLGGTVKCGDNEIGGLAK